MPVPPRKPEPRRIMLIGIPEEPAMKLARAIRAANEAPRRPDIMSFTYPDTPVTTMNLLKPDTVVIWADLESGASCTTVASEVRTVLGEEVIIIGLYDAYLPGCEIDQWGEEKNATLVQASDDGIQDAALLALGRTPAPKEQPA